MMRRFCEEFASRLPPPRVIFDRKGESPYLSRYYIAGRQKEERADPLDPVEGAVRALEATVEAFAPPRVRQVVIPTEDHGLYLHHFHRGDDEPELHSHPWRWAVSLILAGGYIEERRLGTHCVKRRTVRPGSVVVLRASTFHRVELLEHDAWSLILTGPKRDEWGFWNMATDRFLEHRAFIREIRTPSPCGACQLENERGVMVLEPRHTCSTDAP
jgi:hypothetical protein